MSPIEKQQENLDSTEYPDRITKEESSVDESGGRKRRKDYEAFLKESKAGDVLAPSESFGGADERSL